MRLIGFGSRVIYLPCRVALKCTREVCALKVPVLAYEIRNLKKTYSHRRIRAQTAHHSQPPLFSSCCDRNTTSLLSVNTCRIEDFAIQQRRISTSNLDKLDRPIPKACAAWTTTFSIGPSLQITRRLPRLWRSPDDLAEKV